MRGLNTGTSMAATQQFLSEDTNPELLEVKRLLSEAEQLIHEGSSETVSGLVREGLNKLAAWKLSGRHTSLTCIEEALDPLRDVLVVYLDAKRYQEAHQICQQVMGLYLVKRWFKLASAAAAYMGDVQCIGDYLSKAKDSETALGVVSSGLRFCKSYGRDSAEGIKDLLARPMAQNFLKASDEEGDTPLLIAARTDKLAIFRALLEAGSDLGARNVYGLYALSIAIIRQESELGQSLIGDHADPELWRGLTEGGRLAQMVPTTGQTPLHLAVVVKNLPAVEWILSVPEARVFLEARDEDGNTPLLLAAHTDKLAIFRALLEAGADLGARNVYGLYALSIAIIRQESELGQSLGGEHADPELWRGLTEGGRLAQMVSTTGRTPLHLAAEKDNLLAIEWLLGTPEGRGFLEARSYVNGDTPLLSAARDGKLVAFKALVKAGANLGARNDQGSDALGLALLENHNELAQYCFTVRGDLESWKLLSPDERITKVSSNKFGQTPLHMAVNGDNPEGIKWLLGIPEAKVFLEAGDKDGCTPLLLAALLDTLAAFKALVEAGANLGAKSKLGIDALCIAIVNTDSGLGQSLVGEHADPQLWRGMTEGDRIAQMVLPSGQTPLHLAAAGDHQLVIEWLLGIPGARVFLEACDEDGETPFLTAARAGKLSALKALVKACADIRACNNKGLSALYFAERFAQPSFISLLKDARLDFRYQAPDSEKHLSIANRMMQRLSALDVEENIDEKLHLLSEIGSHFAVFGVMENNLPSLERARKCFKEMTEIKPSIYAYMEYGQFLFQQQDYNEAKINLSRAVHENLPDIGVVLLAPFAKPMISPELHFLLDNVGAISLSPRTIACYLLYFCYQKLGEETLAKVTQAHFQERASSDLAATNDLSGGIDRYDLAMTCVLLGRIHELKLAYGDAAGYYSKAESMLGGDEENLRYMRAADYYGQLSDACKAKLSPGVDDPELRAMPQGQAEMLSQIVPDFTLGVFTKPLSSDKATSSKNEIEERVSDRPSLP